METLFETRSDSTNKTYTICGTTYTAIDICVSLAAGIVGFGLTILIACYCIPRTPQPRKDLGVTAREYEALENYFSKRNFWVDVIMIISLGIMTIGGLTLSMIHVYLYFNGYLVYMRNRNSASRNRSSDTSERVGLVETQSTNYGGLEEHSG